MVETLSTLEQTGQEDGQGLAVGVLVGGEHSPWAGPRPGWEILSPKAWDEEEDDVLEDDDEEEDEFFSEDDDDDEFDDDDDDDDDDEEEEEEE